MADFNTAYNITMGNEGGYANNPNDRGGETFKGIARNMHPDWSGWAIIDGSKKQPNFPICLNYIPELESLVRAFYKANFWNCYQADQISNQQIANELFDTGVNMGTGVASTFLQRALNVCSGNFTAYPKLTLDGQIGSKTITALNNHRRPALVFKVLNILQGEKYIGICEANPSQEEFLNSWMSRVNLN